MASVEPHKRQHHASADRRKAILDAALGCFTARGYDRTTIGDVCRAASASIGSVYHHFESKEQLARALFLEGVRDSQERYFRELVRHRSAQQGIRAFVGAYLDWVEAHPDWARFLLTTRHAGFINEADDELVAMNRELEEITTAWVAKQVESGALPKIDMVILSAIVIGPARYFARRWLDKQTRTSVEEAKILLSTSAWHGLVAVGTRLKTR